MKRNSFLALSLCAMLILALLAGCGQTAAGGASGGSPAPSDPEPVENTATLTPTVVCETDSYKLTADSMEVDKYDRTVFNFTFENKTADADWSCTFNSVYFNDILTPDYESELDVAPGESVPLQISDDGFYGEVLGCNYIGTVDIEVKIYDDWSSASPDAVHGVYRLSIDNTSTLPPMGDFVQAGSMKQTVIFENEYARITAMDYDPEFPDMLMTTTPCLILYIENLSDIYLWLEFGKDFAVDGVPMGDQGGAIKTVYPHKSAYWFWTDTFSDEKMDQFDIYNVKTFEFTVTAEEKSHASSSATGLINEHVIVNVK